MVEEASRKRAGESVESAPKRQKMEQQRPRWIETTAPPPPLQMGFVRGESRGGSYPRGGYRGGGSGGATGGFGKGRGGNRRGGNEGSTGEVGDGVAVSNSAASKNIQEY
jgi:hypothetical protein